MYEVLGVLTVSLLGSCAALLLLTLVTVIASCFSSGDLVRYCMIAMVCVLSLILLLYVSMLVIALFS